MTAPAFMNDLGVQRGQEKTFHAALWEDQHGREWSGVRHTDDRTGSPAGPILPVGWKPPHPWLLPPSKYHEFSADMARSRFRINYRRWLADVRRGWQDYRHQMVEVANKVFGAGAMAAIEAQDARLLDLVGQTPMAPEFIEAMIANESNEREGRWALGLPKMDGTAYTEPPAWAKRSMGTLAILETYDEEAIGAVGEASTGRFLDDDDAPAETVASAEIAARLAEASRFADLDDDDTDTKPQPVRRGPGRPRKNASPDAG